MNNGTFASPESLMCKRAAIHKRKPTAEVNNNLCATDFELVWQENNISPINALPTPIFFRNTTPTSIASWLSAISGNIDKVKNSGKNQNDPPSIIIKVPLSARMARELWNIGLLQSTTIRLLLTPLQLWSFSAMKHFKYPSNALTGQPWNRRMSIGCFILGVCVGATFCALYLAIQTNFDPHIRQFGGPKKGARRTSQWPKTQPISYYYWWNVATLPKLGLRTRFGNKG